MIRFNFLCLFVLISLGLSAQVGVGEWRGHLSYNSAIKVTAKDDQVYCITKGGLFIYDQTDNSIRKLNQINGLSDIMPQAMAFGEENNVIVLAYENSNLDLIYQGEVFNLSDIKRKQIQGDKKIYNILVVGSTAYLSCGFGIVAVNLDKREIKDTYYIGENGSPIVINDMTYDGEYLYAATKEGILKAAANEPNLQNFNNWHKIETIPHANDKFVQLEFFANLLIACYYNESSEKFEFYKGDGNTWEKFYSDLPFLTGMEVNNGLLVVSVSYQAMVFNENFQFITKANSYQFNDSFVTNLKIQSANLDKDGALWMADSRYGLVRWTSEVSKKIAPAGPIDNSVFSMVANGSDLWVASGGRSAVWNNLFKEAQAQLYRDGSWQQFNSTNIDELGGLKDLVNVAVDPTDANHVFLGLWGAGVVELLNGEFVERYNQFNSTLQTALPENPSPDYVRIGGMAFDSKNNLWVTNSIVSKALSVYKTDGTWEAYRLPGAEGLEYNVGELVIADNDDQWIVLPRGNDLFVRKSDGTDGRHLSLTTYFTNGENEEFNRMNDIYSIAKDNKGAIWVGASNGVAVFYNPEDIWDESPFYATPPALDLNDGIFHPLLRTEKVTAIAVDGANRKWFGTSNSGVYLVSEDGDEEVLNFTVDNSPLLSNTIQSIAINQENGEVFFGTPEGIISYRGEAIEGATAYNDVYAFPNPVREDYDGDIVITGLKADTDVKITDISGNLVFKTISLGGQAIWNGKNLNGNRVNTGVYIVMGNDKYGDETFTTKILFIH